ncbi:MAG: hypothetical protein LBH35_08480 [Treponema sp.]|jgi:hypothetical protein|nr:hypothetical protein [Treponema sp.]
MLKALESFGEKNGKKFPQAVKYLVEVELNSRGYFRKNYEPGIVDKQIGEPNEVNPRKTG